MAEHAHKPDEHPERHEHGDVNIRALMLVGLYVVIGVAIVFALMYFAFWSYDRAQALAPENIPRTGVVERPELPPPTVPRLQSVPGFHDSTPRQDMARLRAENRAILESYGPTPDPDFARIPIDRAMELAIERQMFPVGGGDENR